MQDSPAILPPSASHCPNVVIATSSIDVLFLFSPVPLNFPSKNCSTRWSFISCLAPLVTSKEGWCLHHKAIPCQTLSGRRTKTCLWLSQSLILTMLSSQYSLFPCLHCLFWGFLLQSCSPCSISGIARCQICSSISSESRTMLPQHYALCHPAAFTHIFDVIFFPKHGKSAISTAASSLPPTFLPNKS